MTYKADECRNPRCKQCGRCRHGKRLVLPREDAQERGERNHIWLAATHWYCRGACWTAVRVTIGRGAPRGFDSVVDSSGNRYMAPVGALRRIER